MSLQCFLVSNDDPDFHEKIKQPGAMWFCPWYYDPVTEKGRRDLAQDGFFSIYYRQEYAEKRAPITVRCPNGSIWMVDQISSNGAGWQVTGEAPAITCSPSIVAGNYHGFLQNGIFTDDLEGRVY